MRAYIVKETTVVIIVMSNYDWQARAGACPLSFMPPNPSSDVCPNSMIKSILEAHSCSSMQYRTVLDRVQKHE